MRRDSTPPAGDKSLIGQSRSVSVLSKVLSDLLAEETSPPVSMKSKTGLNFMVSVGRAIEAGGDSALAKLLQASQELVSNPAYFILRDITEETVYIQIYV